jgi:hypothetical protein
MQSSTYTSASLSSTARSIYRSIKATCKTQGVRLVGIEMDWKVQVFEGGNTRMVVAYHVHNGAGYESRTYTEVL